MNDQNIVITDEKKLTKITDALVNGGPDKLHIIADFDRTLTLAHNLGRPTPSITAILRDHNYLTPDYPARAKALYAHYGAIERDDAMPLDQKKKIMEEWWLKHFELLRECRLNRNDIEKAMTSGVVNFRPGIEKFLKNLAEKNIPLVIMSASGLGSEAITKFFEFHDLLTPNIYIIGNQFVWDEKGFAIDVKRPFINGLNKDETLLQDFPVYEKIKTRSNVILMGDNFGDVGMIEGFAYENLLKIGFLNFDINEQSIADFKKYYDVVILNDGPLDFANSILQTMLK